MSRSNATFPEASRDGLNRDVNGISVIIANYRPPSETLPTLRSVASQTLDRDRFEVILVVNGSQARDVSGYEAFRQEHPDLRLRLIRSAYPGACHSLNLGIEAARMNWLTFVDDDDTISPRFLEGLLMMATPRVVPLTMIDDVSPDGTITSSNRINDEVRPLAGKRVPPEDCPRGLSFNASKLIPTDWARHIRYDTHLRSGQDIAFYGALYMTYDFDFAIVPEDAESVYYRALSGDSQSRRKLDFTFAVEERLDVIQSLDQRLQQALPEKKPLVKSLVRAQAHFMRRYLGENPDQRSEVNRAIRQRRLDFFPWDILAKKAADTLVVSVCWPPYSDPSAVTAAKRLLSWGRVADVLCSDMSEVRKVDESLVRLVDGLTEAVDTVSPAVSFSNWNSVRRFSLASWSQLERRLQEKWPYDRLYSRAMWPASHVLAALIKARHPAVSWTAEFSDPLSKDVLGEEREGGLEADELVEELMEAARSRSGMDIPVPNSLFELAEVLPVALADELIFTNEAQMEYMVSYLSPSALSDLARTKAIVDAHPVPPSDFYHLVDTPGPEDAGRVRLAYFGGFYANRSLDDVLKALAAMPFSTRRLLSLDIYTDQADPLRKAIAEQVLFDVVSIHPTVGYLEFLNLSTKYDCLIIEDARTNVTHQRNPYLPSKWSDYRGSGTPIWAVVEPGSTLSLLDPEYRSRLGSVEEAIEVLRVLLTSKNNKGVEVPPLPGSEAESVK